MLAACGSTDKEVVPVQSPAIDSPSASTIADSRVALDAVCPDPIVVQTDWFPQAEHGGIYELLGDRYEVDSAAGATRGPLTFRGEATGVDLEIRAGGPFIESPVVTEMFLDPSITFGYVGTDVALSRFAEAPTLAVFNAIAVNPQVILWNADKHPEARTIAEIADRVSAVSVFGDRPYMRYLVAQGIVPSDKVDTNYKGNLLLTTDDVAHQSFVTSEPFRYATLTNPPIRTGHQLVHDVGWTSYPQNMAINALRQVELNACLERVVPLLQQAQIDFIESPGRTIATLLDIVSRLDTSWEQTVDLANYAVQTMRNLDLVQNGTTGTFGDFESPRIDDFIVRALPILRDQGLNIPNVTARDITTNQYLDSSISLP
jgi:hypothetical protein